MNVVAQPSQLPSLLDNTEDQNDYLKNTVLKPGEQPEAKIRSLIFIKTSVSKKSCYIGEPVLVVYQLYTAVSCHSRVTKQVSFSGCSVIEMTSDEPEYVQKYEGKIYRVQLIRKVQLIPLQSGDLVIPPATVNNDVSLATTDNPYLQKSYSADVSSQPSVIQVSALPNNKPAGFTGITGKFTIQAKADSNVIPAGENNRLQVTIIGEGNIEAITEPEISWPKHTEHFEAVDSQHINRMNFPESGDKTFSFPFISTKKGKLLLPQISFTYFNTYLKKFETITTEAIPLTITAKVSNAESQKNMVTGSISNQKYLWFVPAIAATVIIVWLLSNRKPKKVTVDKVQLAETEIKPAQPEKQEPEQIQPNYRLLLQALHEAEDNKIFFTNAKILLVSALQFALNTKQADETALINALIQKDETLGKEVKQIFSACNQNLYSPVEDEAARNVIIEQLSATIYQLENNQSVYL